MKLLLDTHIFIWWVDNDARLSATAKEAIANNDNEIIVSVVSLWEIVVKVRARKLVVDIAELEREIVKSRFRRLDISRTHLAELANLPARHRDPFDHLLIAQSISEKSLLVTADREIRGYRVDLFE